MTNVTIKTLTPVHVGSGKTLTKSIDFVFFANLHNKPLAILDEEKIYAIVTDTHFDKWIANIENRQDLLSFLRGIKNDVKPEDIAKRITYVQGNPNDKTQIHEQIHNGLMKPYIPGSSLKGAIRTAIFSQMVQKQPDFAKTQFNVYNPKNNYKDDTLIKHYFADDAQKDQQNKDFLRFLQVGDAVFQHTKIIKVHSYNQTGEEWEERENLAQWTEVIPQEATAHCRIRLWNETAEKNKDSYSQAKFKNYTGKNHVLIQNTETFVKTINAHTQALLEQEKKFITNQFEDNFYDYQEQLNDLLLTLKQCKNNECVLRMGKHTGFNFMTGNWQEKIMNPQTFADFKTKARPKGEKYIKFPLPKTRRFAQGGTPLGFVKLIFNS